MANESNVKRKKETKEKEGGREGDSCASGRPHRILLFRSTLARVVSVCRGNAEARIAGQSTGENSMNGSFVLPRATSVALDWFLIALRIHPAVVLYYFLKNDTFNKYISIKLESCFERNAAIFASLINTHFACANYFRSSRWIDSARFRRRTVLLNDPAVSTKKLINARDMHDLLHSCRINKSQKNDSVYV